MLPNNCIILRSHPYSKRQGREGLDWWHEITIHKTLTVATYATVTSLKTASTSSTSPLSQASAKLNPNAIASNMQPPSVIEFKKLDPKMIKSMRTAGGRGVYRSDDAANQVYEKIPENIRRDPSELHKYRKQHDWVMCHTCWKV